MIPPMTRTSLQTTWRAEGSWQSRRLPRYQRLAALKAKRRGRSAVLPGSATLPGNDAPDEFSIGRRPGDAIWNTASANSNEKRLIRPATRHFDDQNSFLSQRNKLTFVSAIIRAVSSHCELCNTSTGIFRQAIPPPLSSSAPRSRRLACLKLYQGQVVIPDRTHFSPTSPRLRSC
jgi:hypothetical protein